MVPLVKQLIPHFKGVHLLEGDKLGVDGNEMIFKVFFKCFPCSEAGGRGQEGGFLAIFCTFTSRGILFEQGEGGGNSFFHVRVYVLVQVVVVGKVQPEGFSLVGGAIKGIWRSSQQFLIRGVRRSR